MPVTPAPTTSTSTSARGGPDGRVEVHGRVGVMRPPLAASRLYRPVSIRSGRTHSEREGARVAIVDRKRPALPVPFAMDRRRTGCRRSATTTPTSTSWRPSSSGPGSGRWRAGSRRSPSPTTSPSTRSSTSRSSWCAPTTWACTAFQNACRHRGVKVAERSRHLRERVHLPVPRLVLRARRHEHRRPPAADVRRAQPARPATSTSPPVRCEIWGGCAWINFDPDAPPLRECLEPFATSLDAWKVESLRAEWWYACRLPVNWKLADRGVRRGSTTCSRRTRSSSSPARYGLRQGQQFDAADVRRRRPPATCAR